MKNPHTDDLWAVHIIGPDDMIAAPSFEEAEAAAERFNKSALGGMRRDGITCEAEAIDWPHGAESHAHSLRADWPSFFWE